MKKISLNVTVLPLGLTLLFMLLACQKRQAPAQPPGGSEQTEQNPPLELQSYSVHRVKLSWVNKVRDEKGNQESFETAYLVKFSLKNMPTDYGPATVFYIGDYKVREYGPWDGGIYFKIYKDEEMQALLGKEIFYQPGIQTGEKRPISLQKKFEVADISKLTMESEDEVLKRN